MKDHIIRAEFIFVAALDIHRALPVVGKHKQLEELVGVEDRLEEERTSEEDIVDTGAAGIVEELLGSLVEVDTAGDSEEEPGSGKPGAAGVESGEVECIEGHYIDTGTELVALLGNVAELGKQEDLSGAAEIEVDTGKDGIQE